MATYAVKLQRSDDMKLKPHPEMCTDETFADWCSAQVASGRRLAIDLFSGAGGLSLGLHDAGWTVAVAVDHDPKALQTHRHNFPGLALEEDLGSAEGRSRLLDRLQGVEIDLVAGGPPCQPFSRAGRSKIRSLVEAGYRDEHDHRRELWRSFVEVVLAVRPRAVLMENVPDMALTDDFLVVRTIIETLEAAGYHTQTRLVDAWRHGVPQHRKRLILLARLDGPVFAWPQEQEVSPTLRSAIGDLPGLGEGTGARLLDYDLPSSPSLFSEAMREDMPAPVVWDHMTRPVRDDDREIFAMMDSRTLYADIPAHLRRYSAETFDDKYKRLGWDELSRSITAHIAKDGYWYIHPEENRTLTVREAARIQTFPDRFRFAGTRSDAFRQIGNAVPPLLGRAAATSLEPSPTPVRQAPAALAARQELTRWAVQRRLGSFWYLLPGADVTPAVAALVALLVGHAPQQSPSTAVALDMVRGYARFSTREIGALDKVLRSAPQAEVLDRFRPLTRRVNIWSNTEELARALEMKPAQERFFRLLAGEDVFLASQTVLRVAARFAGSDSHVWNRLSDGRVDLSRLVGAGEDAPLRTAALRYLGSTLCRTASTACPGCPLSDYCSTGLRTADEAESRSSLF